MHEHRVPEGMWDLGALPGIAQVSLDRLGISPQLLYVEREPIVWTLVTAGIMIGAASIARIILNRYPESLAAYAITRYLRFGMDLIKQATGRVHIPYVCFILSLGSYLLLANWMVLIPGGEEPTKNINVTFAFSIIAFCYIQWAMIRTHGLFAYLKHYIKTPLSYAGIAWHSPRGWLQALAYTIINSAAALLLFPLELLSRCATILSMSFRLFGNIVGGSIIIGLWQSLLARSTIAQVVGLITGLNLIIVIFFGVFEGAIQAFVFTMLTVTSLGLALGTAEEHT